MLSARQHQWRTPMAVVFACASLIGLAAPACAQKTPTEAVQMYIATIDGGALVPVAAKYNRCASQEELTALFGTQMHWTLVYDKAVQGALSYAAASAKVTTD